jgi:hypothetical protein
MLSLRVFVSPARANLNEIKSLRKKPGGGTLSSLHPFPQHHSWSAAATLADNRQVYEINRDTMLSPNFHLPILLAVLLLTSV